MTNTEALYLFKFSIVISIVSVKISLFLSNWKLVCLRTLIKLENVVICVRVNIGNLAKHKMNNCIRFWVSNIHSSQFLHTESVFPPWQKSYLTSTNIMSYIQPKYAGKVYPNRFSSVLWKEITERAGYCPELTPSSFSLRSSPVNDVEVQQIYYN